MNSTWDPKIHFSFSLLAFLILSSGAVIAQAPDRGLEIAQEVRRANKGFVGEVSETKMLIIDARGRKVERMMEIKTLETKNGNQTLMTFSLPADVKGTKMLTWEYRNKDDDQWLYMPSLKRVKKIYGSGRTASFMGSQFSYEDMGSGLEVNKYDYKFLSEEKGKTWTVERRSKRKSAYSKNIITYSVFYMSAIKIEYYNRRDELEKIATLSDWKKYNVANKSFWRANNLEMKNIQTNKVSIMIWNKRDLITSLKKREFRESSLRR